MMLLEAGTTFEQRYLLYRLEKTLRALMGAREQRLLEPWMEGRIVERRKEYIAHGTKTEQLGTRQGEQLGTRNESRRMRMKLKVLPRNRNDLRKVTQDPKPLSSLQLLCSKVVPSLSSLLEQHECFVFHDSIVLEMPSFLDHAVSTPHFAPFHPGRE